MRYVCRTQRCGVGLKLRVLERKTGREMREGEGRGGEGRRGEERGGEGRSRVQCVWWYWWEGSGCPVQPKGCCGIKYCTAGG